MERFPIHTATSSRAERHAAAAFDFTATVRAVCNDMVTRLDVLSHIDMQRVAVAFAQARKQTPYGMFASLTPMRFKRGAKTIRRNGREYTVEELVDEHGRQLLYILTFYLPRFMDLSFDEKLVTILHELWHISPAFDGDLRRHPGRCYAHSSSQEEYDRQMAVLAKRWLACNPPETCYSFLRLSFAELKSQHGRIIGLRIPRPRVIPVH